MLPGSGTRQDQQGSSGGSIALQAPPNPPLDGVGWIQAIEGDRTRADKKSLVQQWAEPGTLVMWTKGSISLEETWSAGSRFIHRLVATFQVVQHGGVCAGKLPAPVNPCLEQLGLTSLLKNPATSARMHQLPIR